jgi:Uma2 family endonuclease
VLQAVGVCIPGPQGYGGRIPDLTVWSRPPAPGIWLGLDDLQLIVEISSPVSQPMDEEIKPREYAAAGVARYWVVRPDAEQSVSMHVLRRPIRTYQLAAKVPLAWLLRTAPAEHLGG